LFLFCKAKLIKQKQGGYGHLPSPSQGEGLGVR
jgi:hypothetical protein